MGFLPTHPLEITTLIAFGLLLLFGATGGYIAHRLTWLPSITGFMVIGFLIGPSNFALLNHEAIINSRILIDVALALILYRLGLSLDLRAIRRNPKLMLVSVVESGATFIAVSYVLHLVGLTPIIATVIAAIAISSSPAVLLHVAHEVGASGRVTENTKTLVALNNSFSFATFCVILSILHFSVGSGWSEIILQPFYRLVGSLLLGILIGMGLHQMATRMGDATQYRLAFVIGAIMVAIGLAEVLMLSLLVVPLIMGVTIATIEREYPVSNIEFGSAFELFFIVLFVYAGANLHLSELIKNGFLVFTLVLVRSMAKVTSVTVASVFSRLPIRASFSSGLLLIPLAGMAIGLTQTTSHQFPEYAGTVSAIVLGSVALFETIGPPIAKFAFQLSKESERVRSNNTDKPDSYQAPRHLS
ncbi:MAG: cation:proton antiporter [Candidatus Zhuqueibacterota bacterium]